MRAYAIRKMTHADFDARVKRVDPKFARLGHQATAASTARAAKRPILSGLVGFVWAGIVIAVARNQAQIADSLAQGSLPQEYHVYVFGMLAALLAVSGVVAVMHLLRCVGRRAGERGNSLSLVTGIVAAVVLTQVPAEVYETGLGLLDENSRNVMLAAGNSVRGPAGLEISGTTFLSSLGN